MKFLVINLKNSKTSITGSSLIRASANKIVRIIWASICLLVLCGLSFYIFEIIRKYQFDPPITEEISQILMRDLPFPAVTICTPYFARNATANLSMFLKNTSQILTAEEQNQMAANVQACAPHFGSLIADSCPLADNTRIIEIMKSKDLSIKEAFRSCGVHNHVRNCSDMFDYVLTDHGYCFSFNLQESIPYFNAEVISDDFKCYTREIDRGYDGDWTLEGGYKNRSQMLRPYRAVRKDESFIQMIIKTSDVNLCPENGISYSLYFHMPNEIMTPLHVPMYAFGVRTQTLDATYHTVDESLRHYSPDKRECYFDGEKQLKFFKIYTKAHCEFECMSNYTLDVCACVKFSMPRDNLTAVCDLSQTSCYVRTMKEWTKTAKTCACLHSCTYIDYSIKDDRSHLDDETEFS